MLKVKLNRLRNATSRESEKFDRCAKRLEVIVNHPDYKQAFKDEYLEHGFKGETSIKYHHVTKLSINEWTILGCKTCGNIPLIDSPEVKEIKFEKFWSWMMLGEETLLPSPDNEMDIDLTVYRSSKNVVGYTYGNTVRTWINRKYLSMRNDLTACSNMTHEWLHKMGMGHDFRRTYRRKYSVCYTANRCVKKIYNQIFID